MSRLRNVKIACWKIFVTAPIFHISTENQHLNVDLSWQTTLFWYSSTWRSSRAMHCQKMGRPSFPSVCRTKSEKKLEQNMAWSFLYGKRGTCLSLSRALRWKSRIGKLPYSERELTLSSTVWSRKYFSTKQEIYRIASGTNLSPRVLLLNQFNECTTPTFFVVLASLCLCPWVAIKAKDQAQQVSVACHTGQIGLVWHTERMIGVPE